MNKYDGMELWRHDDWLGIAGLHFFFGGSCRSGPFGFVAMEAVAEKVTLDK